MCFSFWLSGLAVCQVLTEGYTLWPLWVWIYCIVWWVIQDTCKVAVYWVMRRYNIFEINTATMVNVRDSNRFSDTRLGRASAGLVEVRDGTCPGPLHGCCQECISVRLIATSAAW